MEIEKKYMSKPNWKRVEKRKYFCEDIIENSKNGKASLMQIIELKSPSIKEYKNKKIIIADKNYYWLQICLENENFWITAMYDDNQKCIQYYIDITLKNVMNKNDDPYFLDLFIDVVKLNTGKIYLLDENELNQALKEQIITKDEYNLALITANKIKEILKIKKNYIEKICSKYFKILYNKI